MRLEGVQIVMEKLKVNIIGVGIMGRQVGQTLLNNPNVVLTATADLSQQKLDEVRGLLKVEKTYTDFEKMIVEQKPDVVYVSTPDWDHYKPVMACLDQKINVQCEKPLTTDEREAAAIVRKVREVGVKFQVSYNHRWLAPYYRVFEYCRAGKLGRPIMGYARKNNPITVPTKMLPWARHSSPSWFITGHDIDLMTWWLDDDPVEVTAYGAKQVLKQRYGWDTYDALQSLVRYRSGAFVTYEGAWVYPETHPSMPDSFMEIIGEKGVITVPREMEQLQVSTEEDGFQWPRSLLVYKVFDRMQGAFPACVNSFIDDTILDREPIVTAYQGWRATAVLDALHKSADANGEKVRIADPPL